ncbi:EAL domain-containing protein [Cupriavidus basilensis]
MSEDLQLGNQRLRVTPSIGMVICPDDGDNLADLLKNADAAMYAAKRGGGAQLSRFSSEMAEASMARFHHRGAAAARAGRASLQAALPAHRRCRHLAHPRRGGADSLGHARARRDPAGPRFIPIAEESGLIMPLGEWILATACREIQQLRTSLGLDLEVAVNISPLQLRQAGFPAMVTHMPGGGRPAGGEPDHRGHRGHPDRGRQQDHRYLRARARARRGLVDRRFRHRLFGPELPHAAADRQAQDRQILCRRRGLMMNITRRWRPPSLPSGTSCICRWWPKGDGVAGAVRLPARPGLRRGTGLPVLAAGAACRPDGDLRGGRESDDARQGAGSADRLRTPKSANTLIGILCPAATRLASGFPMLPAVIKAQRVVHASR